MKAMEIWAIFISFNFNTLAKIARLELNFRKEKEVELSRKVKATAKISSFCRKITEN